MTSFFFATPVLIAPTAFMTGALAIVGLMIARAGACCWAWVSYGLCVF